MNKIPIINYLINLLIFGGDCKPKYIDSPVAPFVVVVMHNEKVSSVGSLVHARWVITTAQFLKSAEGCTVALSWIYQYDANKRVYKCDDVIKHPKYRDFSTTPEYSVCLIELSEDVEMNELRDIIRIEDVPWPQQNKLRPCKVFSYGFTDIFPLPGRLYINDVGAGLGPKTCCYSYSKEMKEKLICLGYRNEDGACLTMLGGPLVCNNYLVGVSLTIKSCDNLVNTSSHLCNPLNKFQTSYIYLFQCMDWLILNIPCLPLSCLSTNALRNSATQLKPLLQNSGRLLIYCIYFYITLFSPSIMNVFY